MYEQEQLSTTQIGEIFQTSRSVINYNLKKLNVNVRPRGKKFNIDTIKNKLNTPEFEYFLGILATDGSICNNIIALEFSEENKEILDHWNNFLGGNMNINIHTNAKGMDYYKITFQDFEFSKILEIEEYDIVLALESLISPVSLFEPIYNDGGDTIYLFDQVEDKKSNCDVDMKVALEKAINKLSKKEQFILENRFFIGKTQMEIADEIGISQAQISRLEKGALKRIRKIG